MRPGATGTTSPGAHAGHLDLERRRPHPLAADRNRPDLEEAKVRFKQGLAFKDRHGPERLAQAYRDMNIRDDG
jgi:hypothetical protein